MQASKLTATVVVPTLLAVTAIACGGTGVAPEEYRRRLREAIDAPVSSPEQSADNSRLVEEALNERALDDMTRDEVEAAIGRGDPCSRHPRCAENGFEDDDWFYAVGQMGEGASGAVPVLIVGFDRTGRVDRSWNLQTH